MSYAPCPQCRAGWKSFGGTAETRIYNCDSILHTKANILEQSNRCKRLEEAAKYNLEMAIIPKEELPCVEDTLE